MRHRSAPHSGSVSAFLSSRISAEKLSEVEVRSGGRVSTDPFLAIFWPIASPPSLFLTDWQVTLCRRRLDTIIVSGFVTTFVIRPAPAVSFKPGLRVPLHRSVDAVMGIVKSFAPTTRVSVGVRCSG